MNDQKVWYLKNYNLFEGIPPKEIERIAREAVLKECRTGCSIYSADEQHDQIYVIKKGEVQLYFEKNGKRFVFDTLGPGSVFGNVHGDTTPLGHHADAGPGSCICVFQRSDFLAVLQAFPEVMLKFLKDMAGKIQEYQTQFDAHQQSADELVLHELIRLNAKRQTGLLGPFFARPLRVTHEDLSQLTGLNRVTVTRSMKKLRDAGHISVEARTGIITLNE